MENEQSDAASDARRASADVSRATVKRLTIALLVAGFGLAVALSAFGLSQRSLVDIQEQRTTEIAQLERQATTLEEQNDAIMESLTILRARNVVFQQMIVTVDCNTREALQEVIAQIEALAGRVSGITVVTPECVDGG